MSVVRREGEWRLEKRDEGVYEVTHRRQTKAKLLTEDYVPEMFADERADWVTPVTEVETFAEAESVFREMAQQNASSMGFGIPVRSGSRSGGGFDTTDGDLSDLPPLGAMVFGLLGGALLVSQYWTDPRSLVFLFGVAMIVMGLVVVVLTYRVYKEDGLRGAIQYLLANEDTSERREAEDDDGPSKTPPAPTTLKDDLYFERAEQQCEWCETRVDSPDVHHIEPRSEGGPNEPSNLIVLCPNCHRKADRGAIPQSKLRRKVSMQMEQ